MATDIRQFFRDHGISEVEAIIRAHVESALTFVDALAEELPFDRAIDSCIRVMGVPEPLASIIVTRVLVVLGQDLLPEKRAIEPVAEEMRPRLRLADASDRSKQPRRAARRAKPKRPRPSSRRSRASASTSA